MNTATEFKVGNHNIGYVSSDFLNRMPKTLSKGTIPYFKVLERNMYDHEIKSELGVKEVSLGDILAYIDSKIPTEYEYNIFYVAGCVVRVSWLSGSREWDVLAWRLGVGFWLAGNRAFGCNAPQNLSPESDTLDFGLLARIEKLEAFYEKAITLIPSLKIN